MAGESYRDCCPNCLKFTFEVTRETRDLTGNTGYCFNCGLVIEPEISFMSLKELNEMRMEMDEYSSGIDVCPPLEELPQKYGFLTCPRCRKQKYKMATTTGICLSCGFTKTIKILQQDLGSLNVLRKVAKLKPLVRLYLRPYWLKNKGKEYSGGVL